MKWKYPKTMHCSWSPGLQNDDRRLETYEKFLGKAVVVTLKMDGENTSMYSDAIHARSLDSGDHPSRHWVKGLWGSIQYRIPQGWRICGENLFALHTIPYSNLESYFQVFSVWTEQNFCLSWEDTVSFCEELGLHTVPVLWEGIYNENQIKGIVLDTEKEEGYVARLAEGFSYDEFSRSVFKWVREGHVQEDGSHWMTKPVVKNRVNQKIS